MIKLRWAALVVLWVWPLAGWGGWGTPEVEANAAGSVVPDDSAGAALVRRLAQIRSFDADFTQSVFGARGEVLQRAEGRLLIVRPRQFRWQVEVPYPQLIVTVGERIYLHDPDLEQVTIRGLAESLSGTPALILAGDPAGIEAQFDVVSRDEEEGSTFVLTPTNVDSLYSRLHLIFANDRLIRIEILDSFGQMTEVSFFNTRLNEAIDPAAFSFDIPAGTEVIDDVGDTSLHR